MQDNKKLLFKVQKKKAKILAFGRKTPARAEIQTEEKTVDQREHFKYLGCNGVTGFQYSSDFNMKPANLQCLCGTIKGTLLGETRAVTVLKFYKVVALPTLLYGSECLAITVHRRQTEAARLLRPVTGYKINRRIFIYRN